MMKKAISAKKKTFGFALILSILFIQGILAIIFGAINSLWRLLAVGCAVTVVCFYGMPLLWTSYAAWSFRCRIIDVVTNEYIYTYSELSKMSNHSQKDVINNIKYLIGKGYLSGFTYNDSGLIKYSAASHTEYKEIKTVKCPRCNSEITVDENTVTCEFCGTPLYNKSGK